MEKTRGQGDGDAAAREFERLKAQVLVMREALEDLPAVWDANRPPDYTPTLAAITQSLAQVKGVLARIEQHPAISFTPQQHARQIELSGENAMRGAVAKLDTATRDAAIGRQELAAMVGSMRGQKKQWEWLVWTGLAAFALGLLVSPVGAALLPFGGDGRVAAFIMKADRWNAGGTLMEAQDPQAWRTLTDSATLTRDNQAALAACRDAAGKAKKEQHCSIVVPAP